MTVGVRVRQHRRLDASSPLDPRLLVRLARPCTPRSRRPFECCHAVTNRCHLAGQTTDTEVSTHTGCVGRRSNDSRGAGPPASTPRRLLPTRSSSPPARLACPCPPRSRRPFECCHAVTNRCHLAGQPTDTEA